MFYNKRRKIKPTIRASLIRSISLLVILPLCLVIILLSVILSIWLRQSAKTNAIFQADQVASSMDQFVEVVNYATSMFLINQTVLNNLRVLHDSSDEYQRYLATNSLSKELGNLESSIMNAVNGKIAVLTTQNQLISFGHLGYTRNDYQQEPWYLDALRNGRNVTYAEEIGDVFLEIPTNGASELTNCRYLHYARTIRSYAGEDYGVLVCQISCERIWGAYLQQFLSDPQKELYVLGEDGLLLALSGDTSVKRYEDIAQLDDILSLEKGDTLDGRTSTGFYYYAMHMKQSPNILLLMEPEGALHADSNGLIYLLWISTIGIIVMILLFFCYISNEISHPLIELAHAIDANHESITPLSGKDSYFQELDNFIKSYNRACGRVVELLEEVRQETRLHERTYYEMLISQISPHFICNTVNSIKYMAARDGARMVEEALVSLGEILQSVYDNSSDLTCIAKELQMLAAYVKIMRMRFGFRFQYSENIPAELYTCEIPTFTLQPLVENAILHGMRDKNAGEIIINAEADEDTVRITLFNNGAADLEKVEQSINRDYRNKSHFTGIGLYNVHSRLRLLYGEAYGLTPNRHLEDGFEIIVCIPRKEASLDDSYTDR